MIMFKIENIDLINNKKVLMEDLSISFLDNSFNLLITDNDLLKESLINVFSCYNIGRKGKISIDDIKINKKNVCLIRNSKISIISDKYNFLNDLTIQDNLNIVLDLADCQNEKLEEVYKIVNLSKKEINEKQYLNKKSNELPNFIKLKFALVFALIKNPKILIFDEPCENCSLQNKTEVIQLLKNLSNNHIVIVLSSNTSLYSDYADQILSFKFGCFKCEKKIEFTDTKVNNIESKTLCKGKLSFKNLLKIALTKPIKNKILFSISSLFSICSMALFLFLFILTNCNTNEVLLKKQISEKQHGCLIQNKITFYDRSSDFQHIVSAPYNDEQVKKIYSYTNNNVSPICNLVPIYSSSYNDNFTSDFINSFYINEAMTLFFGGCLEVDQQNSSLYGLVDCKELLSTTINRFPETYDEIAINNAMAKVYVNCGCYILEENTNICKPFQPTKIDDLIGKRLKNGYKIVGIYSATDGFEEFFEPYFYQKNIKFENKKEENYFDKMKVGFSISEFAYVKPGYSKTNLFSKEKMETSNYFVCLSGKYKLDKKFIQSLSDNSHFTLLINQYSGFTEKIYNFKGALRFKCWIICTACLIVDFILFLIFIKYNSKRSKNEFKTLKIKGASKNAFILKILIQSFAFKLILCILSLLITGIILILFNNDIYMQVLSITFMSILITLFSMLLLSLFVSLINGNKLYRKLKC